MPELGTTLTSEAEAGGMMANPMVSCSAPVLTKTGSQPIGVVAGMSINTVKSVASVTVTEPGTTTISGPNPTVVTPCWKCVYWPVIATFRFVAGSPDWYGLMLVSTAGVLVTQNPALTIYA